MGLSSAAPSFAQTPALDAAAAALVDATGEDLLRAAYATCLAKGAAGATQAFRDAGWQGGDLGTAEPEALEDGAQDEAILEDSELGGPAGRGDALSAMAWAEGGFCAVFSEATGTARAEEIVTALLADADLLVRADISEEGCPVLSVAEGEAAVDIEIASSGNDPSCSDLGTSGVRFLWTAPQ